MALIKCNECGREVSDQAVSCPGCGAPINSPSNENSEHLKEIQKEVELLGREATYREGYKMGEGLISIFPVLTVIFAAGYLGVKLSTVLGLNPTGTMEGVPDWVKVTVPLIAIGAMIFNKFLRSPIGWIIAIVLIIIMFNLPEIKAPEVVKKEREEAQLMDAYQKLHYPATQLYSCHKTNNTAKFMDKKQLEILGGMIIYAKEPSFLVMKLLLKKLLIMPL